MLYNPLYFILEGRKAVSVEDPTEWAKFFQTVDRRVATDTIDFDGNGHVTVSTVFLGVDHSFGGGPPLLFETMVMSDVDDMDEVQFRYTTWDEAERGHCSTVVLVLAEKYKRRLALTL